MTPLPQGTSAAPNRAQGGFLHGPADSSFLGGGGEQSPLLPHLPLGRHNATSIAALSSLSGLSEREVRAEIERLITKERVPVCTLPTSPGIWVADSPSDIDQADAHIRSKAMSLLRRRRALRLCRERLAYSPTLF